MDCSRQSTECGAHLEDAVVDGEDGNIKGAAAQVKHQNVLLGALLVQTVRDGSRCRLIDDPHDVQASNDTCARNKAAVLELLARILNLLRLPFITEQNLPHPSLVYILY